MTTNTLLLRAAAVLFLLTAIITTHNAGRSAGFAAGLAICQPTMDAVHAAPAPIAPDADDRTFNLMRHMQDGTVECYRFAPPRSRNESHDPRPDEMVPCMDIDQSRLTMIEAIYWDEDAAKGTE